MDVNILISIFPIYSHVEPIKRINYVHYDPEMHWCKTCKVFPKTAKDYLTHLHSKDHQEHQQSVESPWHDKPVNDVTYFLSIIFNKMMFNNKIICC